MAMAPAVSRPLLAAVVSGPLSPLLLARLSVSHLGRCDWFHESFSWALGFRASGGSCLHCRLSVVSFGTSGWDSQPYIANWWGRVAPPKKGCGHGWLHTRADTWRALDCNGPVPASPPPSALPGAGLGFPSCFPNLAPLLWPGLLPARCKAAGPGRPFS